MCDITGDTNLHHPFMKGPHYVSVPADKENDVDDFFKWMRAQPRFPRGLTRSHALLFLHACYWNVNATRKAMQRYCSLRANTPELFSDRDPSSAKMQGVFNIVNMTALPDKSIEGYNVLLYRLIDFEPSKFNFTDVVKAFCLFNDCRISDDGLSEGYVIIFDLRGLRVGHLARVQLGILRSYMAYIQEAHPVRLKKIAVCHSPSWINQLMAIVKPFIRGELMSIICFTTNGPEEYLPLKSLPSDYGGSLQTCEEISTKQRRDMEGRYKEWLIDSVSLRELPRSSRDAEIRRENKKLSSSFRALDID